MNKLLLAVLLSSASLLALGETGSANAHPTSAPSNAQSNAALLAQLSARSKAIQSLQGHFVQQKHIAVLPVPLSSSGQFRFEQGKGVTWETLVPVRNAVHITPQGISFDAGAHNAPQSQPPGVEVVAKIFMGVIAGELDTLDDYFALQASGDGNHWQLQLTPRSANLAAYIKHIELQGGELTEQLDIAETNGDSTHIAFSTDQVTRKAN